MVNREFSCGALFLVCSMSISLPAFSQEKQEKAILYKIGYAEPLSGPRAKWDGQSPSLLLAGAYSVEFNPRLAYLASFSFTRSEFESRINYFSFHTPSVMYAEPTTTFDFQLGLKLNLPYNRNPLPLYMVYVQASAGIYVSHMPPILTYWIQRNRTNIIYSSKKEDQAQISLP